MIQSPIVIINESEQILIERGEVISKTISEEKEMEDAAPNQRIARRKMDIDCHRLIGK